MLSHEFKVQEGVYLRGLGVIGEEKREKNVGTVSQQLM